jgi:hypothetical protein
MNLSSFPGWTSALACLLFLAVLSSAGFASDCSVTSVGLTPLSDLGSGTYEGYQGGLYPGGSNAVPSAHLQAGRAIADSIKPLDASGQVDEAGGSIVMVSIGMSNTAQEFGALVSLAEGDPDVSGRLLLVDTAESGQTVDDWARPGSQAWQLFADKLAAAGVTPEQVQVAWMKVAARAEVAPQTFPERAFWLRDNIEEAVRVLKDKYPNVKLLYVSSRIYAGYADINLNPEPFAYWGGFAMKWAIEDQIDGKPGLNYDPALGAVEAPWISWGTYLWADGLGPDGTVGGIPGRSDGLEWLCEDFENDGTHPSLRTGTGKVANMLLDFFKTDSTTTPWFLGAPGSTGDGPPPDLQDTVAPSPPTGLSIEHSPGGKQ